MSLTRVEQPDAETPELPVFGDDAQVSTTLRDFQPNYVSVGFGGSENWPFSSLFQQNEAGYLLEHFGASREDLILSNGATMGMTNEEETAIFTKLDDCSVVPQPPK